MTWDGRKDTTLFLEQIERDRDRVLKRLQNSRVRQAKQLITKARSKISKCSDKTLYGMVCKKHILKIEDYLNRYKYLPGSYKLHLENIASGRGIYEGLI